MKIVLTNHAVERYQERVKPAYDAKQARADLDRLLPNGQIVREHEGHTYIAVAPGIELVCYRDARGYWVALTTVYEGLITDAERRRRSEKRRQRRLARRMKSHELRHAA